MVQILMLPWNIGKWSFGDSSILIASLLQLLYTVKVPDQRSGFFKRKSLVDLGAHAHKPPNGQSSPYKARGIGCPENSSFFTKCNNLPSYKAHSRI
jgi:hypothetical protein